MIGHEKGVSWFTSIEHLSDADSLVNSHILFCISLLGFGSPYLGNHFQVQVTCHLQGHSLGGLGVEGSTFVISFCVECLVKPRALLV